MEKNRILNSGIKNIVYVLLAQLVSLALSLLTSFILPIYLGVTQFGFWQLYLFYTGYVGLFCLGYNDGIYLKYGNFDYEDLPYNRIRSSLWLFLILQLILTALTLVLIVFGPKSDKTFAFVMVAINISVMGLNGTLTMVHQFTNRIKLYSMSTVLTKILLLVAISILLLFNFKNYKYIIIADILTKVFVLIYNVYYCKEIIFGKTDSWMLAIKEMKENMQIGVNLMIANLMGMLVMGLGRLIIERFMSIDQFSLYSFSISSTNIVLLFISSVSLALYPMLKRLPENLITEYYNKINVILCCIIFGMLALYFPVNWIIKNYMLSYSPILSYLYILFPVVVAQGKMQLLVNTYYKTLREEKAMLKANLSSVLIFLAMALPTFLIFHSVKIIALCTLITMVWRCYASEVYLKRKMKIKSFGNIGEEFAVMILFLACAKIDNTIGGFICFSLVIFAYCLRYKNSLINYIVKIFSILIPKGRLKKYEQ